MEESPTIPPEILAHYDAFDERSRLGEGSGLLERVRTQELLLRYLPAPPAVVLDVGGGPGRYALWLTECGYEVHLVDVVPHHVEQAAEAAATAGKPLASATVGDARRLDRPSASVDAVLLLGPLYHLPEAAERAAALAEANRVLRPSGTAFAAGISRFASAIDGLERGFVDDPVFREILAGDLSDGRHRNPTPDPAYFTTAYLHHPDELGSELRAAGFEEVQVIAVEGIGWAARHLDDRLRHDAKREVLLELLRRVESEPSLLGASPHLLAVGRKP